jgi:hypothetical protein
VRCATCAAAYARFVVLELSDIEGELSDNLFDMKAKEKRKITFLSKDPITPSKLERQLKVRSVYDIGRNKKSKKTK